MLRILIALTVVLTCFVSCENNTSVNTKVPQYVLVIHGGAGTILKEKHVG